MSKTRPEGFASPRSITWSEMESYFRLKVSQGIFLADDLDEYMTLIRQMDDAWMRWAREKQADSSSD